MLIMQLMIKYIPKTKMTNIFYETLQNAILGNNYVPLWNASSHSIVLLNSVSKLYIVFLSSNNTPDTLKLLFLLQNIFLNLVISKNSVTCVIWRKKNSIEFTHAVQHHNAMWTCISQRNVIVSENGILQNFIENISNFCF